MITFQLDHVHPLVSVAYRFALAAIILLAFAYWKKRFIKIPLRLHGFLALQGICLFGLNYWAVYQGEHYITSALAAVISTCIIYLNILFSWLLLKQAVRKEVVFGAVIGFVGIFLLFLPELQQSDFNQQAYTGVALVFIGSVLASLGNITSAYTQSKQVPVTFANAVSMTYATVFLFLLIALLDIPLTMDYSFKYISSLLYLAIFGSVIAFACYLSLLTQIGPHKASYSNILFPAVAVVISTFFEGFEWTTYTVLGFTAIMLGNMVLLIKPKKAKGKNPGTETGNETEKRTRELVTE